MLNRRRALALAYRFHRKHRAAPFGRSRTGHSGRLRMLIGTSPR